MAALQAQELRESLDERKREAEERRRAQASRVFIHEERLDADPRVSQAERAVRRGQLQPVVVAYVMNTSQQPVYNVLISWHLGTDPKGQYPLMPLMPGAEDKDTRPVPPDAKPEMFGAVAFFRDASGVTWRTRPDGQLDEVPVGQEPPRTWYRTAPLPPFRNLGTGTPSGGVDTDHGRPGQHRPRSCPTSASRICRDRGASLPGASLSR